MSCMSSESAQYVKIKTSKNPNYSTSVKEHTIFTIQHCITKLHMTDMHNNNMLIWSNDKMICTECWSVCVAVDIRATNLFTVLTV